MLAEWTISNSINAAILIVTAGIGILSWVRAGKAANRAHHGQLEANDAASRSAAAAEEATKLQEKTVQLEEARRTEAAIAAKMAVLHANIVEKDVYRFDRPEKDSYVVVFNSGQASARDLEICIDGNPIAEYDEVLTELPPSAVIAPRGQYEFMFALFMKGKLRRPFNITIAWNDDSSVRGHWESTLT